MKTLAGLVVWFMAMLFASGYQLTSDGIQKGQKASQPAPILTDPVKIATNMAQDLSLPCMMMDPRTGKYFPSEKHTEVIGLWTATCRYQEPERSFQIFLYYHGQLSKKVTAFPKPKS